MSEHRRFFITPDRIRGSQVVIDGETAHRITRVLRLKIGDAIVVLDGSGREHGAEITAFGRDSVTARVVNTAQCDTEPDLRLALAVCVPKGDRMDLAVQKCTELGVSEIIPVVSERTVTRPEGGRAVSRAERWRKITVEAAEQSGRAKVPSVAGIISYRDLVREMCRFDLVLLAWEEEQGASLRDVLQSYDGAGPVMLVVGPEGGFVEREVALARAAGAKCVGLGRRRLRTETAAIAAASAVMYALEGEL